MECPIFASLIREKRDPTHTGTVCSYSLRIPALVPDPSLVTVPISRYMQPRAQHSHRSTPSLSPSNPCVNKLLCQYYPVFLFVLMCFLWNKLLGAFPVLMQTSLCPNLSRTLWSCSSNKITVASADSLPIPNDCPPASFAAKRSSRTSRRLSERYPPSELLSRCSSSATGTDSLTSALVGFPKPIRSTASRLRFADGVDPIVLHVFSRRSQQSSTPRP
ncbi:hypothetical protein K402DRAFT_167458 [Aulographum hederae CBS 113979]|uniref:Uncharacterized protein n=1 Tax=Aulographum hederae CBS 113979 TaxID=1176131 RepID=A0A6G1GRT4_9PEZI|nr:hypothetical protein K402DRAFT_167458 [Aulographum hederae CBS 113979]